LHFGILKKIFSPEDAATALKMKMLPEGSEAIIAEKSGILSLSTREEL